MKRLLRYGAVSALSLLTLIGCAKMTPAASREAARSLAPAKDVSAWQAIDSGQFRQRFAKLGQIPNIGLQLPVVSPNGRWIAALSARDAETIDPDALLTGRTTEAISLVLFDTMHPQSPPRLVAAGAAWPVWSRDSQQLYAVAYDKTGHCGLLDYDVSVAKAKRMDVSVNHIIAPALSPNGKTLAFAGFGQIPQQAKLYTYQMEQRQLTPLPTPKEMVWQILPTWLDDGALLYLGRSGGESGLFGTNPTGNVRDVKLASVPLPVLAADTLRAQAGIVTFANPGWGWLASFDSEQNHLALIHLDGLRTVPLEPGSQAGLWAGGMETSRFIYCTEKELRVRSVDGPSRLLANQSLIPIWVSPGGSNLLLLAPGAAQWTFDLVRIEIEPSS